MPKAHSEPRVCFYPVFTRTEANDLYAAANKLNLSVEDYLRKLVGLDKLETRPQLPVGRPPLSQEEREKREAERRRQEAQREAIRVEYKRLNQFAKSFRRAVDKAGFLPSVAPATMAKVLAAEQIVKEYLEDGTSPVGRWNDVTREHVARLVLPTASSIAAVQKKKRVPRT